MFLSDVFTADESHFLYKILGGAIRVPGTGSSILGLSQVRTSKALLLRRNV
jgi:hypothetical protein